MHYLLKITALSCVFLLPGCQSSYTSAGNPTNGLFNSAPPQAEVNLAQAVQDAFVRTGDPVMQQLNVQSVQNTVMLSGYVKKIRQSDVAEQIAHRVPGVQIVENHIIVRP